MQDTDDIRRFRHFARIVTLEVGALDTSFLHRGRPLGAARVINLVGKGHGDIADIRARLKLDSGLMSRLLRSLEDEQLLRVEPHPEDARRRVAVLTAKGKREFDAYERISDTRARDLLAKSSRREELLHAMDVVALALGRDAVAVAEVDPGCDDARYCLEQYYAELQRRFPHGFEVTRSRNPDRAQMQRPHGSFLVATSDGLPIGCVGLKGPAAGSDYGEIKRLWVAPAARGLGIASLLMREMEAIARDLGIGRLRLDTNKALPEAARMYAHFGWRDIERFNDDPYAELFFEKTL